MADYKDIIAGTLSKVLSKTKEVADSVADTVSRNVDVKDVYEQGASRAKAYGRIAKLSLETSGDQEELKRIYAEIGRLCYEQNKGEPSDLFAPLFAQADVVTGRISAAEQEIRELKEAVASAAEESGIDVEIEQFEDVVGSTETDGAAEIICDAADEPADSNPDEPQD